MDFEAEKSKITDKVNQTKDSIKTNASKAKSDLKESNEKTKEKIKNKYHETKLNAIANATEKNIEANLNKAQLKIERALINAENDIDQIIIDAYLAVEEDNKPAEFVLFKTENKISEICLKADYEIQKATNNLINALENDVAVIEKYPEIKEKIGQVEVNTESSKDEFAEKINDKKEDLSEKIGSDE